MGTFGEAACLAHVHPNAVVAPGACLDPTVKVEPYAVIGPRTVLGPGCVVETHGVIKGKTTIGPGCRIGSHAVIGALPQLRGADGSGALEIGEGNIFREFVTVHVGGEGRVTRIGRDNLFMAYSHVAHDCRVGDSVELANGVQLAGHVQVDDHAALGGLAAIHQFVRVGALSFVGAGAMVSQDVPPFSLVSGDRARVYGLNVVGLRRCGVDGAQRKALKLALRLLLDAPTLSEGAERVCREVPSVPEVARLLSFVETSKRGLCRPVWQRGAMRGREDAP